MIQVHTGSRETVEDITGECAAFASPGRAAATGCCTSSCRTRPPGIAIIETGSGSDDDLLTALDDLLPTDDRWRHRHGSPGHGRDHVLPAFVAPYATLPVLGGRLALGRGSRSALVDPNGDNPDTRVRLSFLAG